MLWLQIFELRKHVKINNKMLPINIDCGENYGQYQPFCEEEFMPYIQYCNVACGAHAGDPLSIYKTLHLAQKFNVKVGAHPSYFDLKGFGRRYQDIPYEELYADVLFQVSALKGMAQSIGVNLTHIKAHGALYNAAMTKEKEAKVLCEVQKIILPEGFVFTMPNSVMHEMALSYGLHVMTESFADRVYKDANTLTNRADTGSVHLLTSAVKKQVSELSKGYVSIVTGEVVPLPSETICIHGDHPNMSEIVREVLMEEISK